MGITTTSITVQTSLDKPSEKALFYVFHALPEWLAITALVVANVRKWFGTGLGGDYLGRDWKKKEIVKFEAKQVKKGNVASIKDGSTEALPLKNKSMITTSEDRV